MMSALRAILLAGTLLVAGCGQAPEPSSPGGGGAAQPQATYDGTWELVSGRGPEGEIPLRASWRITLLIEGTSFGGWSACNQYGAEPVTIDGNSLDIGGVGGTEMGCVDRRAMRAETNYYAALVDVERIERSADTLTLTGPNAELTYALAPEPATASLTDTDWVLEAILVGDGPDGVASSPLAPASIRFNSDGTFVADTGCRPFTGEWVETGDEISFTRSGVEKDCDDEALREQDAYFLDIAPFTFTIEAQALTVSPRFGEADLAFRAPGN